VQLVIIGLIGGGAAVVTGLLYGVALKFFGNTSVRAEFHHEGTAQGPRLRVR
jgi:hypothetical protein